MDVISPLTLPHHHEVALERFKGTIYRGSPWEYQYEEMPELQDMKVTVSAVLLMDVLESITGMLLTSSGLFGFFYTICPLSLFWFP